MNNSRLWRYILAAIIAVIALLGFNYIRKSIHEASTASDKEVSGFLLNFDKRAETVALIKAASRNEMPVRVSWYYEKGGTSGASNQATGTKSTEDPEVISRIYNSLSNTIVMGNATDQKSNSRYHITFHLKDGTECRFDFVSENMVRLYEYNYVIESDGKLWEPLG